MEPKTAIEELIAAGWTQVRIAEKVGCSQPTISEILSGKSGKRGPSFKIAQTLIDLHHKEVAKLRRKHTEAH